LISIESAMAIAKCPVGAAPLAARRDGLACALSDDADDWGGLNLPIDLHDEATGERFAICWRRHENREGLAFLSLGI
jgi:hypothetical protein